MLPTRDIRKATALALVLSATVPGAAFAKPIGPDPTPFTTQTTPIVHVTVPASGFDWADAGIGAAGGLAITMLGVGGALVLSQRGPRQDGRRVARSTKGLMTLGIVLVVGAVGVGVASATVMSGVLADTNAVRERIFHTDFTPSPDQPSFDAGWHIHPGVAIVEVQQGHLNITQSCLTHRLGPGDTYIEVPFLPVDATADQTVSWTSTLILANSAPGAPDRLPASAPACPGGDNHDQEGGD
jgi:hypothetical protein